MSASAFDPTKFIDREFEQELFEELRRFSNAARILGIRDTGGMGKSHLLERFQYRCRTIKPRTPVSLLQLDQIAESPIALIGTIVEHLSRFDIEFPTFRQIEGARVAGDFDSIRAYVTLEGARFDHASNVRIGGLMVNSELVETTYTTSTAVELSDEQEGMARGTSMQAFFRDMKAAADRQSIVLLFDAYERCPASLQRWIEETLLEKLCFALDQRPA